MKKDESPSEGVYKDDKPGDIYYIDIGKINKAINDYWQEKGLK